MSFCQKGLLFVWAAVVLGACSTGPQVTRTQDLSESADAPYEKILVITLLSSFDSRRYLEDEVVKQLSALGTNAVASTSRMNTKTPVTRQTFLAMVEDIDADAVLITQLVNLQSAGKMVDMNPQSTYNVRPTYYFNVWSVELTEYVEPQGLELEHSLVLATQAYSVLARESVWAMEAKTRVKQKFDQLRDYSIYVDEANAIVTQMSRDGLIVK